MLVEIAKMGKVPKDWILYDDCIAFYYITVSILSLQMYCGACHGLQVKPKHFVEVLSMKAKEEESTSLKDFL